MRERGLCGHVARGEMSMSMVYEGDVVVTQWPYLGLTCTEVMDRQFLAQELRREAQWARTGSYPAPMSDEEWEEHRFDVAQAQRRIEDMESRRAEKHFGCSAKIVHRWFKAAP